MRPLRWVVMLPVVMRGAERQPRVLLLTAGRTWHCAPSSQQLSISEIQYLSMRKITF